ncbi:uncharacterized protein LOC134727448 [Mytilus trossulus]|uniref:uncharacterized protein LOC134727448 n=1 Tax=Mytilus trossulus TaxID=6551 RepID=UPI00300778EA
MAFTAQTLGSCAFPCSKQNRVYHFTVIGTDTSYHSTVFSPPGNLTQILTLVNGTVEATFECVHRSGEFYVIGFFNGSNWLYKCIQDTFHGTNRDAIFYLSNNWAPYAKLPTICDVCIGIDYVEKESHLGIDVKCNLPTVCPVTRPGQIQCKACDNEDDGLCCS